VSCARRSAAWALRWIARRFCAGLGDAGLEVVAALLDVRALAGERVELATQVERGAQREGHVGGGAAVAEVLLDRRGGLLVAELDAVGEGAAGRDDHLAARARSHLDGDQGVAAGLLGAGGGLEDLGAVEGVAQHHPGRALDAVAHPVGGALHVEALDGELAAQHREQPGALDRGGGRVLHREPSLQREGDRGGGRVGQRLEQPLAQVSPSFEDGDGAALQQGSGAVLEAGDVEGVRAGVGHPGVGGEEVHLRPGDLPRDEHHHGGAAVGDGDPLREVVAGDAALHREGREGAHVARRRRGREGGLAAGVVEITLGGLEVEGVVHAHHAAAPGSRKLPPSHGAGDALRPRGDRVRARSHGGALHGAGGADEEADDHPARGAGVAGERLLVAVRDLTEVAQHHPADHLGRQRSRHRGRGDAHPRARRAALAEASSPAGTVALARSRPCPAAHRADVAQPDGPLAGSAAAFARAPEAEATVAGGVLGRLRRRLGGRRVARLLLREGGVALRHRVDDRPLVGHRRPQRHRRPRELRAKRHRSPRDQREVHVRPVLAGDVLHDAPGLHLRGALVEHQPGQPAASLGFGRWPSPQAITGRRPGHCPGLSNRNSMDHPEASIEAARAGTNRRPCSTAPGNARGAVLLLPGVRANARTPATRRVATLQRCVEGKGRWGRFGTTGSPRRTLTGPRRTLDPLPDEEHRCRGIHPDYS
jgi:hypothetical protein